MKHTLIALACTLAFAGGHALAQDRSTPSKPAHESTAASTAESAGHKARNAAHRAGQKARHMGHRMEDKMGKAGAHHEARRAQEAGDDARAMGAAGSSMSADSERRKRMDQAYEDYKSGRSSNVQSR